MTFSEHRRLSLMQTIHFRKLTLIHLLQIDNTAVTVNLSGSLKLLLNSWMPSAASRLSLWRLVVLGLIHIRCAFKWGYWTFNGFQLTAGGNSRWETSATPTTNTSSNAFSQLSEMPHYKNNVAISRSSNTITDVIAGTTLKLQADTTATVNLSSSRSKDNVMSSVKDMISNINSLLLS